VSEQKHYNKLSLTHETSEACVVFKAGKNCDGYFTTNDLMQQVEKAVAIFESKTNGTATVLFMFNNAPSHQCRAPDALSARHMVKGPHPTWTHHKGGLKMHPARFSDGSPQNLYYPENHPTMPGWFKGMQRIIEEHGLWPEHGLPSQCLGFKCQARCSDCCMHRVLFTEPDFGSQHSHLEEFITSRGHICDFYPKFHCKLNFIEQYWGAAKFHY